MKEVIFLEYKHFWPGDKVITIVDYNGIPSGSVGKVVSRWIGKGYAVRIEDGTFRWLNSSEIETMDASKRVIKEGDIGVVSSNKDKHNFVEKGEQFRIYKIIDNVDYYGVNIDGNLELFAGFQLAKNIANDYKFQE